MSHEFCYELPKPFKGFTGGALDNSLWNKIKDALNRRNPDRKGLSDWLDPVALLSFDTQSQPPKIVLGVPSPLHHYYINQHVLPSLAGEFELAGYKDIKIELSITGEKVPAPTAPEIREPIALPETKPQQQQSGTSRTFYLNPNYTFRTFVVGKNNEFAHAASYSVAEKPGDKYNPLFICGPSGMGKTHLLCAVGNEIRERYPDLRIRYISAERFISEFVSCIRHKEMDKFIERYRVLCDVLLMDDIHELGRTESCQDEFFYTLNALFERGCQVVVASDKIPRDINGLEERIRTRLEWGLIADIQMPDVETRVVILRYKAELLGIHLPEDVINFIARISKRSIRELEGNLNKVKMFTELQGLPITLELAKQTLAAHASTAAPMTQEDIQKLVAQHFSIRTADIKSATRAKPIVTARHISMWLCKKYLSKSLMDIGRTHGGKDHTSVMNALRRIEDQLTSNSDLKRDIDDLESRIHNLTGI